MRNITLSPMEKQQALLLAGRIRYRATFSIGHEAGFPSEQTRRELLKIAELLESKGQPHRGRRGDDGVTRMAFQLEGLGYAPMRAARFALAYREWVQEFHAEPSARIRKQMQTELDDGLNDQIRTIATTDARRVVRAVEQLKKSGLMCVVVAKLEFK